MSNQLGLAAFDLDSGGGTEFVAGISLRISGAGGSTEAKGSSTSALSIPVVIASDQGAVSVDTELPTAAALADAAANPTVPGVGSNMSLFNGTTWDRVRGTIAEGLLVNLGAENDVIVTSGNIVADTELPTAAALADATANPTVPGVGSFLQGFNGTTWDRVRVANTGRLQVDIVTGGGSDTPTNPVTEFLQTVDLASNASADLDTTGSTAANTKLSQVEVWSSVAFQADIFTVDNSVESTNPLAVGGGQPMSPFIYKPPHRDFITLGSTAGDDAYRIKVTNLDDSRAADINATIKFED